MEEKLQKKALASKFDYRCYEKLGDYYLDNDRPSLALFCFVESLRINQDQAEAYKKIQGLLKYSRPIRPKKLKPDSYLVSVIMRTYNRLDEIRDSIQSVLSQSINDFELIIINDGGLKEIKDIAESFSSDKIKYIRLFKNKGPAGAFNAGLLAATGKYIAYLDDDDIFYPDHLEKLSYFLESNPQVDCVYSNSWWCYGEIQNNKFFEKRRELKEKPQQFDKEILFKHNYITTLSLVYKRSCLLQCGLFNEDFLNMEDWEHFLRLALIYRFHQIDDITGEYRWKSDNGSIEKTKMTVMSHLIFNFHHYNYLSILQLRHALEAKNSADICKKFDDISSSLSQHLNRHSNVEFIFKANIFLAKLNIRSLRANIVEKYFTSNSLSCVKLLIQNGQWKPLAYLAFILIRKILLKLP